MILNTEFFRSTKLPKPDVTATAFAWRDYDPNTGDYIASHGDFTLTINNLDDYPEGTVFKYILHEGLPQYEKWYTFESPLNSPFDPEAYQGIEVQATHEDFEESDIWDEGLEIQWA